MLTQAAHTWLKVWQALNVRWTWALILAQAHWCARTAAVEACAQATKVGMQHAQDRSVMGRSLKGAARLPTNPSKGKR